MKKLAGGLVAAACVVLVAHGAAAQSGPDAETGRPRLTLRAQPNVAVAPARILLTVELVGGANDYQDFYCPTIVWEWGDDTRSESSSDCDPFVAGKSEIRRRYTVQHEFRRGGVYKLFVRFKQRDREVGVASTTVTIRPGFFE